MGGMLREPYALLWDFGGVLADAPRQPPAPAAMVRRLFTLVNGTVSTERITSDLAEGARSYASWRDDVGTSDDPVELPHTQVWADFVTRAWPQPARDAVEREATSLAYAWTWRSEWQVRPGVPEALRAATEAGLPMAVVSNTLCGAAHRDFLATVGLSERFAAEFYSDEAGPRKPNPRLAQLAADAIGVPIRSCWFIGDSVHRDIVCARRAGAGAAILMRSPRTDREPPHPDVRPDARVEDGHGLLALLHRSSTVADD
ncbi:HAD family hydrolase [Salinispora tropica]|uniref:HAD-superfamily hydrolase, subfamily IA, variant 1 n=1 Tax=Salinispora tropica (strain ATCC BAA-916 / DSM 44818 / JCM 13857 / NBRC 105044 / CNB-440) TaxID=369723 RepID=A4X2Y2_SALTO|nr:HAD family hydrolase [Salinispora tropica]ABP53232.1 HAD-superfamily hydrolase, subfamily IA, variant 1 [Salinispora tropica CNB-440]